MHCAGSTVRFVVIAFNALTVVAGVLTATLCGLAINSLHHEHLSYCILGICVGVAAFAIALLGCFGAKRESVRLVWAYIIGVGILIVAQLAIVVSYHARDIVNIVTEEVDKSWSEEIEGNTQAMKVWQSQYHCCGLHSYLDYENVTMPIPHSCYNKKGVVFDIGCFDRLTNVSDYVGKVLKITNWALTCIQLTALIFAVFLIKSFQRSRYDTKN